jgi:hypothetical protein
MQTARKYDGFAERLSQDEDLDFAPLMRDIAVRVYEGVATDHT